MDRVLRDGVGLESEKGKLRLGLGRCHIGGVRTGEPTC